MVAGALAAAGTAGAAVAVPWSEIFSGVLGAGGVPPALFLLIVGGMAAALIGVTVTLRKEQEARDMEREAAAKAMIDIQEKRLLETREMLLALERTGTALTTHTTSLESRTVTLMQLVKGVEDFALKEDLNRRYFEEVGKRIEEGIKTLANEIRGK